MPHMLIKKPSIEKPASPVVSTILQVTKRKRNTLMQYYSDPKAHKLEHEIHYLQKRMKDVEMRYGKEHQAILNNYREMIRSRQELIVLLGRRHGSRRAS